MNFRLKLASATCAICLLLGVNIVEATNGYFTHGTGTKNKGMAGAGIALPQDAVEVVNNPAVATRVGRSMQLGAALFSPIRSYQSSPSLIGGCCGGFTIGPNDLDSDSEYFVIPHFARVWQREPETAFAVSVYGRGGMNTDWKGGTASFDPDGPGPAPVMTLPGTFGGGNAGVDLLQAFVDVTWATNVGENTSLGLAGVVAMQMFEARGIGSFAGYTEHFAASGGTSFPSKLSNNGHDISYGAGLKLGLHSQLTDRLAFGLMYQTKIWMTEFDDYADLFAEQGDFDIPANFKMGLTWEARDQLFWSFDVEHSWFSDVDAVGNSIMNIFACPTAGMGSMDPAFCLGGSKGAGFGWDDVTTYKLGVQWSPGEHWTWRAGYSHAEQPIADTEMTFNILAPAVVEDHWSVGFTKRTGAQGDREWNVALTYVPSNSLTGLNNFDPTQTITLKMHQIDLEVSYSWRF